MARRRRRRRWRRRRRRRRWRRWRRRGWWWRRRCAEVEVAAVAGGGGAGGGGRCSHADAERELGGRAAAATGVRRPHAKVIDTGRRHRRRDARRPERRRTQRRDREVGGSRGRPDLQDVAGRARGRLPADRHGRTRDLGDQIPSAPTAARRNRPAPRSRSTGGSHRPRSPYAPGRSRTRRVRRPPRRPAWRRPTRPSSVPPLWLPTSIDIHHAVPTVPAPGDQASVTVEPCTALARFTGGGGGP